MDQLLLIYILLGLSQVDQGKVKAFWIPGSDDVAADRVSFPFACARLFILFLHRGNFYCKFQK